MPRTQTAAEAIGLVKLSHGGPIRQAWALGGGRAVATVHVFVSSGRFHSLEEIRRFIDETYTEDGDGIPSAFMREVGLDEYEPSCIEAIHRERSVPLTELLGGASYSDQWLPLVRSPEVADSAICVFEPNVVEHPEGCSLLYCGAFEYKP